MCDSRLGATESSIQVIPAPLRNPSWTKKSSSIIQFQPLVPVFFCADIKYYFLNNPKSHYKYVKIHLRWFPQYIIGQYNIMDLVDKDGFVYVDIRKGMYGLNKSAPINFDGLVKLLKPHGYHPLRSNPGIWCHGTLSTKFALCVDNFGTKYTNPAHAHHLVNTLKKYYTISIDWGRKNDSGLTLDWNNLKMMMSPCLAILKKPFTSFSIQHLRDLKIPRMTGMNQPMAQESNIPRQNRTYQAYNQLVCNDSNPLRAPFYIIPEKSISPCSPP